MLDCDHHRWHEIVGNRLVKSKISVWETLANEWVKSCVTSSETQVLVDSIREELSKRT
jgi:hypothetical protein